MAPKRYLSLRARLGRRRHRRAHPGAGPGKTRPWPRRSASPSFLAPATASGPRLLSGRASGRDLGASAGGGGKREKGRGAKGWEFLSAASPSRLKAPRGCRGVVPAQLGREMGEAQGAQYSAEDPGRGRRVSFRRDSSMGARGRAESMGTSRSGPGPCLSQGHTMGIHLPLHPPRRGHERVCVPEPPGGSALGLSQGSPN